MLEGSIMNCWRSPLSSVLRSWRWVTLFGMSAGAVASCSRKPPPPDFERRCAGGDLTACAKACSAGALGETGCMAALKDKNPARRAEMLGRACKAKVKRACLPAAEASVALNMNRHERYESLLAQGCKLGSREACYKLGDFLLLDAPEQARQRYLQGCKLEKEAGPCVTTVTSRVRAVQSNQVACRGDDVVACERLLLQTATRNQDLAYLAASRICKQRGLDDYYGSDRISYPYKLRQRLDSYERCGLFLVARAAGTPPVQLSFSRAPVPFSKPAAKRDAVELTHVKFHFRNAPALEPKALSAAQEAVEQQMTARLDSARRCVDPSSKESAPETGEINLTFLIDRLGDPIEVRTSSAMGDHALRECLASALVPERFTGKVNDLGRVVRVEAIIAVHR